MSIATHTFNYGTAVFEGIRAYRQADGSLAILFAREHYERMLRNARLLRASVPESAADLRRDHARPPAPQRARRRRLHPAARLQVRALHPRQAHRARRPRRHLHDPAGRLPADRRHPASPCRAGSGSATTPSRPAARSAARTSTPPSRQRTPTPAGYDDAILLTGDGHVAEASAANIFVVCRQRGGHATPDR